MNITSRSKYALKTVLLLARTRKEIARREDLAAAQGGVSPEYLEKILLRLKEHRILEARSGPGGGFRLLKPAANLTVWDVVRAVEESPEPVACLGEKAIDCDAGCDVRSVWSQVWNAALSEMKKTSIASLASGTEPIDDIRALAAQTDSFTCR